MRKTKSFYFVLQILLVGALMLYAVLAFGAGGQQLSSKKSTVTATGR